MSPNESALLETVRILRAEVEQLSAAHLRAVHAAEAAECQRDLLAQAMWDARAALGYDNDGDPGPGAAIAGGGYGWYAAHHVEEAKQQAHDYEEVVGLWDGKERKDWTARAEAAEARVARVETILDAEDARAERVNARRAKEPHPSNKFRIAGIVSTRMIRAALSEDAA